MKPLGQILALLGVLALFLDQTRTQVLYPLLDDHARVVGGVLLAVGLAILLVVGATGWTNREQVKPIDPR